MSKSFIIWPYGYHVEVIQADDIAKARQDKAKEIGSEMEGDASALHSYNEDKFKSWLFFRRNATPGIIAHECHHCLCKMFSMIGAKKVDEEVHAYTLEWLVDEVNKRLNTRKK